MIDRVDWHELRAVGAGCYEPFFVIAQKISRQWKFFEEETGEVRWHEVPSTNNLVVRLVQEIAKKQVEQARGRQFVETGGDRRRGIVFINR